MKVTDWMKNVVVFHVYHILGYGVFLVQYYVRIEYGFKSVCICICMYVCVCTHSWLMICDLTIWVTFELAKLVVVNKRLLMRRVELSWIGHYCLDC